MNHPSRSASYGASAPPYPPPPPGYSPGPTSGAAVSRSPFTSSAQPSPRSYGAPARDSPVNSPGFVGSALNQVPSPSLSAALRQQQQQLQLQLHQQQHASGVNSPHSPFGAVRSPASQTGRMPSSSSVMVEYNPQQWGPRGPTGGVHIPHSQLSLTAGANPETGGEKL
jgi:hypothetical protein